MSAREILTIQFGDYANHIGTHWWNIQETNFSYTPTNDPQDTSHDVFYREGELNQQITFTPRLLLADLKDNFGYLSEQGNLYHDDVHESEILWYPELIEKNKSQPLEKNLYLKNLEHPDAQTIDFDLDTNVETWVDYLYARFHPRTVNIIQDFGYNAELQSFNLYTLGEELWKTKIFSEDFSDKIRMYIEECNSMQGFQVIMDGKNGFSGLGSACLQYLQDEYNKSIITFPVFPYEIKNLETNHLIEVINTVMSFHQIAEYSSLFSPISCSKEIWTGEESSRRFRNISYKPDSKYHSSAILASALDTLSLQYRSNKQPHSVLSELCADLNYFGRKAVATSLSMPFPMIAEIDLIDMLDDLEENLWTTLTPYCDISNDKSIQNLCLRGIPESRIKKSLEQVTQQQIRKPAYKCSSVHEMMSFYLASTCFATASHLNTFYSPLNIKSPYPQIFNERIDIEGNIAETSAKTGPERVPVMSGLHSGMYIANMYDTLYHKASKIKNLGRFHAFKQSGLENDEFYNCIHSLLDYKEAYEEYN